VLGRQLRIRLTEESEKNFIRIPIGSVLYVKLQKKPLLCHELKLTF